MVCTAAEVVGMGEWREVCVWGKGRGDRKWVCWSSTVQGYLVMYGEEAYVFLYLCDVAGWLVELRRH